MRRLVALFHFLGSLPFAILLIATTALTVMLGTFLESKADSHAYAAGFTYDHPFFRLLFWLFFVNILFSSLRRWPFKWKHLPFLTTHLGLLMILGGLLIKSYFGTQGNLSLLEGGESDQLLVPQTEVVAIEKRSLGCGYERCRGEYALGGSSPFEELNIRVLKRADHTEEQIDTWIQGEYAVIHGIIPQKVVDWSEGNPVPQPAEVTFSPSPLKWNLYAVRTKDVEALIEGIRRVQTPPSLALIQDNVGDALVVVFDPYEGVLRDVFPGDTLNSVIAYDEGFGGYSVQTNLPLLIRNRSQIEEERINILSEQLKRGANDPHLLSPPLKEYWKAVKGVEEDFGESFVSFLSHWKEQGGWLYPESAALSDPLKKVFEQLDFEPSACIWTSEILTPIEEELGEGHALETLLEKRGWPLSYDALSQKEALTQLTQQIFSVSAHLPEKDNGLSISPEKKAHLFSALLRAYLLHVDDLLPLSALAPNETFSVESPVHFSYHPLSPLEKIEENRPALLLEVKKGSYQERVALGFHSTGQGLKQPILFGNYLARFQPKQITLPYKVRLKQARQINYAHSSQPFSYEADLVLTHVQSGQMSEETISMNNVYETWEGYRFYLANLSSGKSGDVKRIQLIVNHDPAKYILTYPGGIVMVMGIVAFLLAKSHRPKRE